MRRFKEGITEAERQTVAEVEYEFASRLEKKKKKKKTPEKSVQGGSPGKSLNDPRRRALERRSLDLGREGNL